MFFGFFCFMLNFPVLLLILLCEILFMLILLVLRNGVDDEETI
jgi:hypothetical protein